MAKHNNTGRNKSGPPYVQLFHWIRKTEAWRSLAPYSRLLYIEIRGRFNGSNNGEISMSHREAMEILDCSDGPIKKGFKELEDRGFIVATQKGAFDWKTHKAGEARASRWLLTELPQHSPERSLTPRYDFKKWVAEKKSRCEKIPPIEVKNTTINSSMMVENTTNGGKIYHHNDSTQTLDGGKIYRSYNIPDTPLSSKPSSIIGISTGAMQSGEDQE